MKAVRPSTLDHRRTARRLLTRLLCGSLLVSLAASAAEPGPELALPEFGDSSGTSISPLEAQRKGAEIMRTMRASVKIDEDPDASEYLQGLGDRLLAHADPQPFAFSFFVVADPNFNAFAGPGGYFGVNSGLILATEGESELASVLAHEISHVTQHHLLRAIDKSNRLALPATAALSAARVLAGQNAQLGQAALATTLASGAQACINFTRTHELEADRVGLHLLAGAGFDPRSMPAFFEQLQQATRFYENGAPELLQTHPVTSARIAATRNRAEQYPRVTTVDSLSYLLVRAKLRVLTSTDAQQTADYFAKAPAGKTRDQEDARRYGYALALPAAGQTLQDNLRSREPRPLVYKLLAQAENDAGAPIESKQALAEYAYLSGQTQSAIDYLNQALALTKPDDFYRASRIEARLKEFKSEVAMNMRR